MFFFIKNNVNSQRMEEVVAGIYYSDSKSLPVLIDYVGL